MARPGSQSFFRLARNGMYTCRRLCGESVGRRLRKCVFTKGVVLLLSQIHSWGVISRKPPYLCLPACYLSHVSTWPQIIFFLIKKKNRIKIRISTGLDSEMDQPASSVKIKTVE